MTETETKGRWVADKDLRPSFNIWQRKWRVTLSDGSRIMGTYMGQDSLPLPPGLLEWFVDEVQG